MIKISNLKLPLDYGNGDIKNAICKSINIKPRDLESFRILKTSIDARKKDNIYYTVSVAAKLNGNEDKLILKHSNVESFIPYRYSFCPTKRLLDRPVIVGSGPAGLFAALVLCIHGEKPIVIERGKDVDKRSEDISLLFKYGYLNTDSNIQFGEGGAGTFSDGKLNTGTKDSRAAFVLETFARFGAGEEILTDAKPHIGTDVLKIVIKNIRKEIISLGGEFIFEATVNDLLIKDGALRGVLYIKGESKEIIHTSNAVLAVGHSARDTFNMLYNKGIIMEQKPFSMGVRIEHLAESVNKSQYGKYSKLLPTADYKLNAKASDGRGVYTFCMCPGGVVVNASSEEGLLCTNGMSYSKRNGNNSNSAVLVSVYPKDFQGSSPLAGIELQRQIERKAYELGGKNYCAPVETVGSFLKGKSNKIKKVKPTFSPGYTNAKIENIFPSFITNGLKDGLAQFAKRISAFEDEDGVLTAAETRSSSPLRIIRNEKLQALGVAGLYPCGEGAGYAGGIVSAAVDGIKCAEMLLTK